MRSARRCSNNSSYPATGSAEWPPDDRLRRGTQYAAAFRLYHWRLWNTGSPAFAGDDGWWVSRSGLLRRHFNRHKNFDHFGPVASNDGLVPGGYVT